MPKLYAVGTRYDRLISVSGFTTSDDGYTWTSEENIVEPFLPHQSAIGVATDGITLTAISDDGYVASSNDGGRSWLNGTIIDGNLGPRYIDFSYNNEGRDGLFMLAGNQKYSCSEIMIGSEPDRWKMVYTVYNRNDVFTEIQQFDAPMLIEDVPLDNQTNVNHVVVDKATYPLIGDFISNGQGVLMFSMNPLDPRRFVSAVDQGSTWRITFSGTMTYTANDTVTFDWTTTADWAACGTGICLRVGGITYAKNDITNYGIVAQRYDEVGQIFRSDNGDQDSWIMVYSQDDRDSTFHSIHRFAAPLLVTTNPLTPGTATNTVEVDKASNPLLANLIQLGIGYVSFSNDQVEHDYVSAVDTGTTWIITINGTETYSTTDTVSFSWTTPGAWVACGESGGDPLLVYSIDSGNTWNNVAIPTTFAKRPLYDVTYVNEKFYLASYGVIITATNLTNPTWSASDFITSNIASPDFVRIAKNPSGHLVAAASGMILYSLDGSEWNNVEIPGYQFTSVVWYNDHWVVGCYTLLTHWTCFVSTDTVNWTPDNNQIHMYDFYAT